MPTFGERAWQQIAEATRQRLAAGKPSPTREERIAMLDAMYDSEMMRALADAVKAHAPAAGLFDGPAFAATCPQKAAVRRQKPLNAMTEAEFLSEMEERFSGIDVKKEIGRCQWHFRIYKNIVPTRNRIVNWLKREERMADSPLNFNGAGMSSLAAKKQTGIPEPQGWREWVRENARDPAHAEKPWASLDRSAQAYILTQLTKTHAA